MSENCILRLQDKRMAFELDKENCAIYGYENMEDIYNNSKKSKIIELSFELACILEFHFEIIIEDYGINIVDETIHIPSLSALK